MPRDVMSHSRCPLSTLIPRALPMSVETVSRARTRPYESASSVFSANHNCPRNCERSRAESPDCEEDRKRERSASDFDRSVSNVKRKVYENKRYIRLGVKSKKKTALPRKKKRVVKHDQQNSTNIDGLT